MGRPANSKDSKKRKQKREIRPEDLNVVRENLPLMSVKQLANKMGLSESSVKRLAKKCGIKKIGAIKEVLMEHTQRVPGVFLLRKRFSDKVFLGYSDDIGNLLNFYSQSFPQFNYTNYAVYILVEATPQDENFLEEECEAYKRGLGTSNCESISEFFAA